MMRQEQDPGAKEEKAEERRSSPGSEDSCRCRETAEMKPRELLKLMIRDLAFWKKAKK